MAATRPVVTPRAALTLALVTAIVVALVGFGLLRGGGDEGLRSGASLPPPGDVKTPAPANRSFEGLTTFRGNDSRSYYGEGPVPQDPVIRWREPSPEDVHVVAGRDRARRVVRDRVDGPAERDRARRRRGRGARGRLRRRVPLRGRAHRAAGAAAAADAGPRERVGDLGSRRIPPVLRGLPRQLPPGGGARPVRAPGALAAERRHLGAPSAPQQRLGRRAARRRRLPARGRRERVVLRDPAQPWVRRRRVS